MKRLLFEVHRWGGIALALFMTLWFFSGLLIVFAEPGAPTRAEQLAHADQIRPDPAWLSTGEAWERSAEQRKTLAGKKTANGPEAARKPSAPAQVIEARLLQQAGRPLWLIEDSKGQRYALSAIDGTLQQTSAEQALKIAGNWAGGNAASFVETLDKPAILRNQDGLRPFHRIAIDDGAGSELLVSARTGEVVHASTLIGRGMYWAGNWVHLFRPLELAGASNDTRVEVLTWTSGAAVIAALTGLIVGWLRWRPGWFGKKTYSEGRVHPYRNAWFKWHFWAGLIGGTLALTWGLSGFLNNNPWELFSPANPGKEELARYVGGIDASLPKRWRSPNATGADVVELSWRRLGDDSAALASARDGRRYSQTDAATGPSLPEPALQAAVRRMVGDVPVASLALVREYDSYYYLRHHRDVADRPLPVVRVELGDDAATHLYIDPQDGRLLLKQDDSRRVYRWLYSALHHWDFGWLYQRPLWDAWMVAWVLFGLTLSATAVVLGWKRLALTLRRRPRANKEQEHSGVAAELATENRAG